ncbi:MAG: hypothetical protein ABJN42_10010 [Roseibium sp.]|uniref:hypothetical protein n=1 Tax=Roseibium sp. TaxID=1936156 RepID=UPI003299A94C
MHPAIPPHHAKRPSDVDWPDGVGSAEPSFKRLAAVLGGAALLAAAGAGVVGSGLNIASQRYVAKAENLPQAIMAQQSQLTAFIDGARDGITMQGTYIPPEMVEQIEDLVMEKVDYNIQALVDTRVEGVAAGMSHDFTVGQLGALLERAMEREGEVIDLVRGYETRMMERAEALDVSLPLDEVRDWVWATAYHELTGTSHIGYQPASVEQAYDETSDLSGAQTLDGMHITEMRSMRHTLAGLREKDAQIGGRMAGSLRDSLHGRTMVAIEESFRVPDPIREKDVELEQRADIEGLDF